MNSKEEKTNYINGEVVETLALLDEMLEIHDRYAETFYTVNLFNDYETDDIEYFNKYMTKWLRLYSAIIVAVINFMESYYEKEFEEFCKDCYFYNWINDNRLFDIEEDLSLW